MTLASSPNAKAVSGAAAIFGFFTFLYSSLRSKDIFAVDGAHRCLAVWHRPTVFFHANNHMLYPVNVLVWTRFVAELGLRPNGPLQFFSIVELMNCVAGAACMAILYCLVYSVIRSFGLALGFAVGCGFSKAFLEQATNANEPLVGVLWSLVALVFAVSSFKIRSKWPIFLSGLLFSLAMATYQSTIFLAPAAIVFVWFAGPETEGRALCNSEKFARVASFVLGGFVGCISIYGWAYRLIGITNPAAMLRNFFGVAGGSSFVRLDFYNWLKLPAGLIQNIFPGPGRYTGMRNLLAGSKLSVASFLLLLLSFCTFSGLCFGLTWARWASLPRLVQIGLLSASVGLVFTAIPLLITYSLYDKLWLQPLACLAFVLALAMNIIRDRTPKHWPFFKFVAMIFLVAALSNCVWAIRGHNGETFGMQAAQEVAARVGKKDLVVGGWDNVSMLYSEMWADQGQFRDFTDEAQDHGRDATVHLREAVVKTQANGGRVYFLGLLDVAKRSWDVSLGSVFHVPFSDLDFYRAHSNVVTTFKLGPDELSFSELELLSPH